MCTEGGLLQIRIQSWSPNPPTWGNWDSHSWVLVLTFNIQLSLWTWNYMGYFKKFIIYFIWIGFSLHSYLMKMHNSIYRWFTMCISLQYCMTINITDGLFSPGRWHCVHVYLYKKSEWVQNHITVLIQLWDCK